MTTDLILLARKAALSLSIFFLAACDSGPGVTPDPDSDLDPAVAPLRDAGSSASIEWDVFNAWLTHEGSIETSLGPDASVPFSASASGLWLAGTQSGANRSSIVYFDSGLTTECGGSEARLFALDADTTYTNTETWPESLGAPTEADGSPRVYGDQMLWGSFCTRAGSSGRHADPIQDVRINTAVYRYERDDLAGVRFVRYEVTNEGIEPLTDLRIGYFADVDSPVSVPSSNGGRTTFYDRDAVGYDATQGLTYVYQFPFQYEGSTINHMWVSGYAFLDLSPLAHRILRRYSWQEPEGFGQGPASATEAVLALDGLSYNGDPMIDPTTGSPSRFAFPSNPFDNPSGWVDGRDEDGTFVGADVRQLLSAGPVSLGTGETLTFTVVWVTSDSGATSFESYQAVQQTLAAVRAEPSLWQFDDGS